MPLLSYALLSTWENRTGDQLTVAGYRGTGGIEQSVAAAAERAYGQLQDGDRDAARRVLLRLVRVGEHGEATRRRIQRADAPEKVIEALAEVRLVVLDQDTVDITHEALLRAWPRLRSWVAENRESLRVHRQLTEAADAWRALDEDPGALYRGTRLALAKEHAGADLTQSEQRFLDASVDAEAAAHRAQRRRTRRQRQLIALLSVLLLVSVVASMRAIAAQQESNLQRDVAVARKTVADADQIAAGDPALAVQLKLAAFRIIPPTTEMRDAVMSAFTTGYRANVRGHTSDVPSVAFAPDRPVLATISWDRTARLWDVADVHHPKVLSTIPLPGAGSSVAFRGTVLATTDQSGVRLWDVGDPRQPREIASASGEATWVAFGPGGLVATAHPDGEVRLWDDRLRQVNEIAAHQEALWVSFSPDGSTLATSGDTTAKLWRTSDLSLRTVLKGHSSRVQQAVFSPDGTTVATASWDHDVRLWDAGGELLTTITAHDHIAWAAAFSPDGRTLATNGGTTILWDLTDRRNPRELTTVPAGAYVLAFSPDGSRLASSAWVQDLRDMPFAGHDDFVTDVEYRPDGRFLASSGWDRSVRLWEPGRPQPVATLTGSSRFFRSVSYTPDGTTLAAASEDGDVWLWDVTDPHRPRLDRRITAGTGELSDAEFSPDGSMLAAVGDDAATVFDARDGYREIGRFTGQREQGSGVKFSPDSRLLVVTAALTPGRMWDLSEPRRAREVPLLGDTELTGAAFRPDGKVVALSLLRDGSHVTKLVDLRSKEVLAEVAGGGRMAFSRDGRRLATPDQVRLYDVADPRRPDELAHYAHHNVQAVALSPDGRTLVSGGNDSTVRLWETDFNQVVDRVCVVAFPRITEEQWRKHFPGVNFQPPCGS